MLNGQVRSIVAELPDTQGDDFFKNAVTALCRETGADYVSVSLLRAVDCWDGCFGDCSCSDADKRVTSEPVSNAHNLSDPLSQSVLHSHQAVPHSHPTGRTLAFCHHQRILDNVDFELDHTPCGDIPDHQILIINQGIQRRYPQATSLKPLGIQGFVGYPLHNQAGVRIGFLVAMFKQPFARSQGIESLFVLSASLITGELTRRETSKQLLLGNSIIEKTSEGVFVTNCDNLVIYVNEAYQQITGYSEEDVLGKPPRTWMSKYHSTEFFAGIRKAVNDNGHWSGEIFDSRKDGSVITQWLTVNYIESGEDCHYVGIFSDISQRKATEEKMFRQANYDPLTGLANRQHFLNRLEEIIALAKRHERTFGVLFLDLDLFKSINDSLGHQVGDQLLIQVAHRLKLVIRETDVPARLGGDEFTIILSSIKSTKNTELVALKVIKALNAPFNIDGNVLNISASVGISLYPDDSREPDELLNYADQAMYFAKQQGKNCFSFFTKKMQQAAERRLWLKNQLIRAIAEKEFSVAYQPIVNRNSRRVEKIEALARWRCKGEDILPDEFIPVAEEFGLISDIGGIVLESACQTLKKIHQTGFDRVALSVNRSTLELCSRGDIQPDWLEVIRRHELPPSSIIFEITESLLAPENNHQQALLADLRAQGCHIAIDDFGTGYSSLSYLHRFPVDTLKIDRSFISPLTTEGDSVVLVSTIIAMAKSLGINVVAEGVETHQQMEILEELECDFLQGHFFSKPLLANELNDFLRMFCFESHLRFNNKQMVLSV